METEYFCCMSRQGLNVNNNLSKFTLRKIIVFSLFLFGVYFQIKADEVDSCINLCQNLYEKYFEMLPEQEQGKWKDAEYKLYNIINQNHIEAEKEMEYYREYKDLAPYKYLNITQPFKMQQWTQFVNDMGKSIFIQNFTTSKCDSLIQKLATIFDKYKGTENASLFYREYEKFLQIKLSYSDTINCAILSQYSYEEKIYYNAPYPKIDSCSIYDWVSKIEQLEKTEDELQSMLDIINRKEFLVIKDTSPLFSIILCILIIICTIPSYCETFNIEYYRRFFIIMVIVSLVVSTIFIWTNPTTYVNCLASIFFPGGFFLYYSLRKKNDNNTQKKLKM